MMDPPRPSRIMRSLDIDSHDIAKRLACEFDCLVAMGNAGVVHQQADRSQFLFDAIEGWSDHVIPAHINGNCDGMSAKFAKRGNRSFEGALILAGKHDPGAVYRQYAGDFETDSGASASYQCNFSRNIE